MTTTELDQLRALAQSATPGPWRVEAQGHAEQEVARVNNLEAAARYLRDCAEAEPVATVRVHDTGGNAGIAWSGVPTGNAGVMRGGTPLYAHPHPPVHATQPDDRDAMLCRNTQLAGENLDLAILVRRLALALRTAQPDHPEISDAALDYLRRIGHVGGVLR